MAEEHTTEIREPDGSTHRHTIVVTDNGNTGGGAGKWLMAVVALVAVIAIVYVFSIGSEAEIAKDNAMAEAAGQVGNAAEQVGDTVENVGNEITGGD